METAHPTLHPGKGARGRFGDRSQQYGPECLGRALVDMELALVQTRKKLGERQGTGLAHGGGEKLQITTSLLKSCKHQKASLLTDVSSMLTFIPATKANCYTFF
jgi:hypothetical protein